MYGIFSKKENHLIMSAVFRKNLLSFISESYERVF